MVESKSQAAMEHRIAARPRTLVLLASFNGAAWIEEQLRTILDQANTDVQIVVRDDGSSDETIAIANRLRDPRIDLVRAAQPSGSAAQNFFAMIREHPAEGCDYVAFADQDDAWGADKLDRASSALAATRAAGYSSAVTAVWANGRKRDIAQAAFVSSSTHVRT